MEKQHFFVRLIPPRASFAQDMSEDERCLMLEHVRYVRKFFDAGKVLIFGPVLDSAGAFGVAILEVESETVARDLMAGDPSVLAGLNRFELFPMRVAAARACAN